MKKMNKIIIASILLLFLFACSKEKNKIDSENQQKFVKVYTELIKLSERIPLQTPEYSDSAKKIFTKYNFTKKDFNSCVSCHNQKPKRWETFFQAAYDTLKPKGSDKPLIR